MSGIQQSGNITPGHLVKFLTTGVIGDAGVTPYGSQYLALVGSLNFNTTNDQPIQIPNTITAFQITGLIVTNASISLTTAAGGFYPTTAKGGTAIVASGQVYSSLTSSTKLLLATVQAAALATRFSSANMDNINGYLTFYLSLTTPQGAGATADVYVLGTALG